MKAILGELPIAGKGIGAFRVLKDGVSLVSWVVIRQSNRPLTTAFQRSASKSALA